MKLTDKTGAKSSPIKLTEKSDIPFVLAFRYALQKKYTFEDLSTTDLKDFQRFLDKVANMTVSQVDKCFARQPDKRDKYNNLQVYHYAVTDSFRIHVVLENCTYHVLRLDPNHKFHK